jgi:HlyD family secretion protein
VDIARPDLLEKKKRRRVAWGAAAGAAIVLLTVGVSRLKPAAPTVERATVVIDTVKRGEMVREVRGLGTLVPEEIRWIPAVTDARVERLVLLPGTKVTPDSVILELSNPELEIQALDAESQARAAEARYTELKVRLESQNLDQRAVAARVEAEAKQARLQADADEELARNGLIAGLTLKLSQSAADELENRRQIEQQRLAIAGEAIEAQLRVQQAEVEQRRAQARLRRSQVEALRVRAGLDGVLQMVPVEVGQQVTPGTNLARVARPDRLKAVVRVPETQARDVVPGQKAVVDTRNGGPAGPDRRRHDRARTARRRAACGPARDGPAAEHGGPLPPREGDERGPARPGAARPGVGEHDRDPRGARRGRRGDPLRHLGVGLHGPDPTQLKRG